MICLSTHLEIVSYEAAFESGSCRVLDREIPSTKYLVAHVHTVTLPEHPGVLVANRCPIGEVCRFITDTSFKDTTRSF